MRLAKCMFFLLLLPSLMLSGPVLSEPTLSESSFKITANEIISGLNKPILAVFPPGRTLKFLVFESGGKILWADKETKSSTLLYNIAQNSRTVRVVDALCHPQYEQNGGLFVAFVEMINESVDYVIQEYRTDEKAGLRLHKEVLRIKPTDKNEKDFSMALDSTGSLLIAFPDGADNFDPKEQAQDRELSWGKVLRFNIKEPEYIAPIDNPFVMEKTGKKEIYAVGFREPADMFFDAKENIVWISDRGADTFQELNILKSGANYGWSMYEGSQCLRMQMECSSFKNTSPFYEYTFRQGKKIAISPTYRGKNFPEADGYILIHDVLTGITVAIKPNLDSPLERKSVILSDMKHRFDNFTVDGLGEIYAVSLSQGAVFSLQIDSSVN